ncbi:MAG TPA: polysaccharide biosynthesis tyrosine autokinase [Verrucomicrobiae bacterium]|nr:polysaccharide biosynthesis tyrosine autokinase [Verrucomicrobiae bacterium]
MDRLNSQLPAVVEEGFVDFPELLRTLSRYKWRVVATAIMCAVVGTLLAFSEEPTYRASATILIEARSNRPLQLQEAYDPGIGTSEYYGTQTELLRSRDLIGAVVDKLGLTANAEILPPPTPTFWDVFLSGTWLPFLPEVDAPAEPPISTEVNRELAIDGVRWRLSVGQTPRTQLVNVHVETHSPQLAMDIVNTLSDLFVTSGLETRLEAAERSAAWLNSRLADMRKKLERSEQVLQTYREQHKLVNVGSARGMYEEEVTDNARKLRDAQRKKTELASAYWKIQQAGNDDAKLQEVSALLLDPTVQRASDNLLQAEQAIKQLQERYGARHPQMTNAQARLDAASRAYYIQLRLAANGVKAEYDIASETERALLSVVESGKQQIRKLDQNAGQLQVLERDVQTNRELYDLFLRRYKETDTASTFDTMTSRIVDRAALPLFPFKPNKPRVILLWTFGGILVGLLLAAAHYLLSEAVRSPEQLEHAAQLPVLSVLPPVSGLGRKASAPSMVIAQPRAPFSEGMRSIRASLQLSDVDKRMKRIMLTSAVPREGKSSIASSFAVVLSPTQRVVLVEADLRAPSLKKIFDIPATAPGIVELLSGQAKLDQVMYVHEPSGLHVLPVAQIPANPGEVVSSAAFGKLLDILSTRYDRVIVDTPPCQVASDTLLLAHRMDAVLFVVHGANTGLRTVLTAIKHLRAAQAPLLGFILNQVDARRAYGYDGSYYVYGNYGPQ